MCYTSTVKPVYKCQPRGISNVAFVDEWPLFGASKTTYPMFTGRNITGLCEQVTTTRMCPYALCRFTTVKLQSHYTVTKLCC